MTPELTWQRNDAMNFSALGTVLTKSFTRAFSSNSRPEVFEVSAQSVIAVSRYRDILGWVEIR